MKLITILLCSTYVLADAAKPAHEEQLIIDADPGIDDVLAILIALQDPRVNVLGITVVRGNTELNNALINTLKTLIVAGKTDVPVYAGAEGGLVKTLAIDNHFGEDGLRDGPWRVQPSLDKVQTEPAAAYLAKSVKQSPGEITVICLGPLTNIALAIHLNPSFLRQVKRLVILGGTFKGKGIAADAEFNMYADPDAAAFVLDKALTAGVFITHIPMETVKQTDLSKDWRWNTVAKLKSRVVEFLNKIESEQARHSPDVFYHPYGVFAVAAVLDEKSVLGMETLHGTVETNATRRRSCGALMFDNMTESHAPNLQVVTQVSDTIIKQLMYTNLAKYI